jgi:hypothetical protein
MLTSELAGAARLGGCILGRTSILNAKAETDEGTGLQAESLSEITGG